MLPNMPGSWRELQPVSPEQPQQWLTPFSRRLEIRGAIERPALFFRENQSHSTSHSPNGCCTDDLSHAAGAPTQCALQCFFLQKTSVKERISCTDAAQISGTLPKTSIAFTLIAIVIKLHAADIASTQECFQPLLFPADNRCPQLRINLCTCKRNLYFAREG